MLLVGVYTFYWVRKYDFMLGSTWILQQKNRRLFGTENDFPEVSSYLIVVVGPVLKIKTGFWCFDIEQNPEFEKFAQIWSKFNLSGHELYCEEEIFARYFEVYKLHLSWI